MDQKNSNVFGHPAGLFILFFTEMWERFSYYGMRALLVLFLVSELAAGGWAWPREDALQLYAFYTGLVYLTPILGGLIADKLLGYKISVFLGALLMTLGHGSIALETEFTFYTGLVLLVLGNGFFKPNISSIVGQLYEKFPERKDAGYTVFYMGINAGAFLGILLCGYIGEKVGWSYGFGLAGIFMFFGMLQFWFARKIFGDIGDMPHKQRKQKEIKDKETSLKKKEEEIPSNVVRDRLIVIGIFSFFTIFFWMAFEQAGGSMTIFAKDYTGRVLTGNYATLFFWVNTFLTIVPLAVVSWVLFKLFTKTFKKYALSNLFLGLSFVIIWGAAIWMLQKEVNTKAYEVEYLDNEKKVMTTLRIDQKLGTDESIYMVDLDGEGKFKYLAPGEAAEYESTISGTVVREKHNETEVPASWFGILNSFFIIAFAPLFSKIWESKVNPTGPIKFAMGLILLGLGFAALAYGGSSIQQGANTASVSMIWLILAYFLHTMGELCLSPVGLSYVSKLSPPKFVGLMFGVWFAATAIANYLAGWTGSFIDKIKDEYSLTTFFLIYTILPLGAGIIMILLNPLLKRLMHGIR